MTDLPAARPGHDARTWVGRPSRLTRISYAIVRAARRSKEVTDLDYETVAADLARRDALDQGRESSPLRRAGDAVVVDTSDLDIDEIVELIAEQLDA